MTPEQRKFAISTTANYAIEHGNRLKESNGIGFTLPTLFINDADKHDIATLVHSRSNNTIRFKSTTKYSISFHIIY